MAENPVTMYIAIPCGWARSSKSTRTKFWLRGKCRLAILDCETLSFADQRRRVWQCTRWTEYPHGESKISSVLGSPCRNKWHLAKSRNNAGQWSLFGRPCSCGSDTRATAVPSISALARTGRGLWGVFWVVYLVAQVGSLVHGHRVQSMDRVGESDSYMIARATL